MSVIYVLLPAALAFAAAAVVVFLWAARSGQFDDLETPAVRILHDEDEASPAPPGVSRRDATADPTRDDARPGKPDPRA